jgi:glyceraldehyde 3-phosphate dehydrogenase
VVSNASCTTNAAALVCRVLDEAFGVRSALTHAVHSTMVDQRLLDTAQADPRLMRAAGLNIVPTSTTAASGVGRLLPALEGRVEGMGSRVPVPAGAMLDLVAELASPASPEAVGQAFQAAARGPLAGLLEVTKEPLVSSDFLSSPASAVIDLPLLQVAGERLCRVVAWYDNEWGYAQRLADLLVLLAKGEAPENGEPR